MKKIIKSVLAASVFLTISCIAVAQTDSTAVPAETPVTTEPPAPDPNAIPVDQNATPVDPNAVPIDASAIPVMTDSTGAPINPDGTPAGTSAGDKPATRHKLYSGKHRGNNVIYDPK